MKKLKRILSMVPPLALWAMLCVLVWGFVFIQITDTAAENKLVLCIDTEVPGDTALASVLEEELGDRLKMVQVKPFTYAMFDGETLTKADLFIVRCSHMEAYRDWFAPLPEMFREEASLYTLAGVPLGVRAYDAKEGRGITTEYIKYLVPGEPQEDYYLVFGAASRHNGEMENAADDLAADAARLLLKMQ